MDEPDVRKSLGWNAAKQATITPRPMCMTGRDLIWTMLMAAALLLADSNAQQPPRIPPPPPLPPVPRLTNSIPRPTGAPNVSGTNVPVTNFRQINRRAVGAQTSRSNQPPPQYFGPYMNPTIIPGLTPLPQVGPPVPLAPSQPQPYAGKSYPARTYSPPAMENVFAYDGLVKETTLKPGERTAWFTFSLTNTSSSEVTINAIRTSCGCTVARIPSVPWKIAPGTNGTFDVTVDVTGKFGIVTKTVTIDSSAGYRYLTVRVSVPPSAQTASGDRARNLQVALADRQAVFRSDCAVCHLTPGEGKLGEDLYDGTCAICHDAAHRASMVPNLRALNKPTDAEYWRKWMTNGKTGGLMPAWAKTHGGPFNEDHIDSLVQYLTGPFTNSLPNVAVAPTRPVQPVAPHVSPSAAAPVQKTPPALPNPQPPRVD